MNTDLTFQIFVQCAFKSIIEYFENSELCASNNNEDQTTALNFGLGDQPSRTSLARTFSSGSTPNMNITAYKLLLENVTHFIERMVDKIWDIEYREPKQIFEFTVKIINQAKRRGANNFLDSLFRSLNRTVLFELSRKTESIGGKDTKEVGKHSNRCFLSDQMIALDALHRLANNRQLIFSDANQDAEFFGCLCYCLIVLIDETGTKQSPYDLMKHFFC